MPKPTAAQDIPELTGLRVLAALCVVVSHLHGLEIVSAQYVHDILDGGRPAVAFFFVLSGFIMNHMYPMLRAGDTAATRRYALSRVARLYPTLLFSLLLAAPSVIHLMTIQANDLLLKFYAIKDHHGMWLSASGAAQLLGITGWLPAAALNQPWNGPAWSLSCEFFFYTTFPFLLPVLQRQSSRTILVILLLGWLAQGAWIMGLHAFIPPNRSSFLVYQFPLTHLYEFVAGISAGLLLGRLDRRELINLAWITALLAALMLTAIALSGIFMPASYGMTPLFLVLVVLVVWHSGSPWLAPLRNNVVVALGHSSYALYIVHAPVLVGATLLGIGAPLGWWWLALLMMMSLAIHYWYAEPVRKRILGRRGSRPLPNNGLPRPAA